MIFSEIITPPVSSTARAFGLATRLLTDRLERDLLTDRLERDLLTDRLERDLLAAASG